MLVNPTPLPPPVGAVYEAIFVSVFAIMPPLFRIKLQLFQQQMTLVWL
jgi:hypothetical protein